MYSKFFRIAGMQSDAYEFLMQSRFFSSVSAEGKLSLLMALKHRHLQAGEHLIRQGEPGDCLYLIQNGTCSVVVERDDGMVPITVLGREDIVGEMALLTGEERNAHVYAQTEADVWQLDKKSFEELSVRDPEIRHFLTDIVTSRFSRSPVIAERTIGKYVVNEMLGQGGWSFVYKGVHATLNMPVAVKMLKHTMAMEPEFMETFLQEARIIANLNHENIVKVYDIEQIYRTVFIVMEYLEGVSLQQVLQETPRLSLSETLRIVLQVCHGLAYAHASGIVHGDIKPGNIFITTDEVAKIVDFGLACPAGAEAAGLRGTPSYISPEQIRMVPADARSDIYSLGIMTYRLLTGELPFQSGELSDLLKQHLDAPVPDPRRLVPDLPQELVQFIFRAMAKNPENRYRNLSEVCAALQPVWQHVGEKPAGGASRHCMTGLVLFYRDDQHEVVKRLVKEFTEELNKIGVRHHESEYDDV